MRKSSIVLTFVACMATAGLILPVDVVAKGKPGGGGGGGTPPDPEIAFFDTAGGSVALRVMDADGGNPTTLIAEIVSFSRSCCWSPDRAKIYFDAYVDGLEGIFAYELATRSVTRLFTGTAFHVASSPYLGASGTYLVSFMVPAEGAAGPDIWVYDPDTDSTQNLTAGLRGSHYGRTEAYATWSVCTAKTCFAYLYTIASQTMQRIPTKNKRPQYSPALDEANGRVYFVRSGVACGAGVTIFRVPADNLSATPTKILALPTGIDVEYVMSLAPNANGTDRDLLFERVICEPYESDVYQADAVNTVPDA